MNDEQEYLDEEPKNPDESIIVRRKELFSDSILPQNKDELAKLLDDPLPAIAEVITGAIAVGAKGMMLVPARLAQGALKAKLFQQFGQEVKDLREKGKIPDDFADRKHGYQSFVEVMTVIDQETPDEDRMEAIRALFFAVNKMSSTDQERVLNYQLLQIAKRLSSGQLILLGASFNYVKERGPGNGNSIALDDWANILARYIGHELKELVLKEEKVLVEEGLFTPRNPNGDTINQYNFRLSSLGLKLAHAIDTYREQARATS